MSILPGCCKQFFLVKVGNMISEKSFAFCLFCTFSYFKYFAILKDEFQCEVNYFSH